LDGLIWLQAIASSRAIALLVAFAMSTEADFGASLGFFGMTQLSTRADVSAG
jgi:hypothetical protein